MQYKHSPQLYTEDLRVWYLAAQKENYPETAEDEKEKRDGLTKLTIGHMVDSKWQKRLQGHNGLTEAMPTEHPRRLG